MFNELIKFRGGLLPKLPAPYAAISSPTLFRILSSHGRFEIQIKLSPSERNTSVGLTFPPWEGWSNRKFMTRSSSIDRTALATIRRPFVESFEESKGRRRVKSKVAPDFSFLRSLAIIYIL